MHACCWVSHWIKATYDIYQKTPKSLTLQLQIIPSYCICLVGNDFCYHFFYMTRQFSNHESRLLSRSHTCAIIVILDLTPYLLRWEKRSLTPRWPLTPHLLRTHVWLYPARIIVSKSHENTSKYVDTVTLFAKTWTIWKVPYLLSGKCWSQRDRWIIIVLLLFEKLNQQAFYLWKKSLDNLSPQDVTPQS